MPPTSLKPERQLRAEAQRAQSKISPHSLGLCAQHWGLVLALAALQGCGGVQPSKCEELYLAKEESVSSFDPATSGIIHGRVLWQGVDPIIPRITIAPNPLAGQILQTKQSRPNPNTPIIRADTRGVGSAVVFLRSVDPKKSKPWDHPPVQIEMRNSQLQVSQGEYVSRVGFLHRGDRVRMVSCDPLYHSLHAGGAAFFTLTFPDPNQPLERVLGNKGIVEWTSSCGYCWMRSYVLVDDHPYYARTDPNGNFELTKVPPGSYEVVCWMPNWTIARHERDIEAGTIFRLFFNQPVEQVQRVTLGQRQKVEVSYYFSTERFTSGRISDD